jgi:uncharacterized membrane protein YfcA
MDWTGIMVMVLALGAGAVVKGASGMGLPLIALPVITAFFGLQHAIGLMVIPLIATNAWQVWRFRREAGNPRLAFMPVFLVAGALGIGLGTWALTSLPERLLVLGLGCLLLTYVALRLATPHWSLPLPLAKRLAPFTGIGGGILQGATGVSGPIGMTYIHAMALDRDAMVFAVSAMFFVLAAVQLPSLWVAGVLQPEWMLQGVFALMPVFLLMPVGQWVGTRLSRRAFDRMILVFLAAIGLKMVLGL